MKSYATAAAMAISLIVGSSASALAGKDETNNIVQTLTKYEVALNAADVGAIVKLYTADGVQMAPDYAAAVGSKAIEASYAGTFKAIALKLKFNVDEVKILGPNDALIRSHSSGTVKINGNDTPAGPVAFKELFVLHKQGESSWKFSHYSFSTIKLP